MKEPACGSEFQLFQNNADQNKTLGFIALRRFRRHMVLLFGCVDKLVKVPSGDTVHGGPKPGATTDTGHKGALMPGVTSRMTGHNAHNAPGIIGLVA